MGMNPLEDQSFEDKEDSDFMSRNDNIEMSRKGLINEPTERDASKCKQLQQDSKSKGVSEQLGDVNS